MKRLVSKLVIFLQRWGFRLHLSRAAWRRLDRVCLWLARPFFGPVPRG